MADFNSSLPVRTENNGDVVAKIVDGTVPSQALAVDASGKIIAKLNDGAGNSITSQANGGQQALDVGINVSGVQVDPRDIRALTSSDVVTADQGAPNSIANGWPVKPTDGTNSQSYTAAGEARVDVTQPLPAGTNNIGKVSIQDSAGSAITASNPLPVYVTEDAPGTEINDYKTDANIAANASANHDYSVPTGTFQLLGVLASASGKAKIEVQYTTDGLSYTTKAVMFNSTANPNMFCEFKKPVVIAGGASVAVRVIRTNKDNQSQDLYSTIMGQLV